MGKKGKKKKKSKEELEEEARIAAEEAAKAAEEARIAAEEEAKRLAEEHRLRQEFLLNERNEELARLVEEENDNSESVRAIDNSIENSKRKLLETEEWARYTACLDISDPLKETELNTFMSTWLEDTDGDLKRTLSNCQRAEIVCKEANTYLARSKGAGDEEKAQYFEKYMGLLRNAQLEKNRFFNLTRHKQRGGLRKRQTCLPSPRGQRQWAKIWTLGQFGEKTFSSEGCRLSWDRHVSGYSKTISPPVGSAASLVPPVYPCQGHGCLHWQRQSDRWSHTLGHVAPAKSVEEN